MKFPTLVLAAALLLSACSSYVNSPNQVFAPQFVVSNVDQMALTGTWHQIASLPQTTDKGCASVTWEILPWFSPATLVRNTCMDRATGTARVIEGQALVEQGGRIRVRMPGQMFAGDFWVLDVAPDGRSVTIGNTARTAGWVMTRDAGFNRVAFDRAIEAFQKSGYDAASLQRTR